LNYEQASSHQITVQVQDAAGATTSRVFVVTINNVNEVPNWSPTTFTTDAITPIQLNAPGLLQYASDPENAGLTVSMISGPGSGSLVITADGSLSYSPDVAFEGSVTFVVEVSDGQLAAQATFTIVVNQPPVPPPAGGGGGSGSGSSSGSSSGSGSSSSSSSSSSGSSSSSSSGTSSGGNAAAVGGVGISSSSSSNSAASPASPATQAAATIESNAELAGLEFEQAGRGLASIADGLIGQNIELMRSSEFMVSMHTELSRGFDINRAQRLMNVSLNALEGLQWSSEKEHEFSLSNFDVDVNTVVVTALGTGVAVWMMYLGQVVVTLLSTSATWVQIDPLVIIKGNNEADDQPADSAEEKLFD
jgi:Bacterial Ig domain